MLSIVQLEADQRLVYANMDRTPSYLWPQIAEHCGVEVWLKHENHTPIGAFKVRGGLIYAHELVKNEFSGRIVTATRGNHGQSIPYAACRVGIPVTVYVPQGNSVEKNRAMRHWGAEVVEYGTDFDEARQEAERIAAQEDAHLVPSFHENLIRGVSTYGAELFQDVADLDVVFVPIGMGSGACSLIAVRDLLGHQTEVIGVVSDRADAVARSWQSGTIESTATAHTFADGMATRMPQPDAFAMMQQGLADVVRVSDDEIADAIRLIFKATHNVAEGAGAAALAAVMQQAPRLRGRKVAAILSGGNIDTDMFVQVLTGATPVVN